MAVREAVPTAMAWLTHAVGLVYSVGLALLVLYGARVLWLTATYLAVRRRPQSPTAEPGAPAVTVQIPLYNERHVAARAIDAACRLRWPGDLEIQILDDSSDETAAIVDSRARRWRHRGVDIHVVRRATRDGYKAGALAYGTRLARGRMLALFDADFVPPPDFLERTMPYMGSGVAAVQARWGHLNEVSSGLTRAQALALDGYFIVEQTARSRSGQFLVFNGSAGVWRREALEQAGGWLADTLSEDVDLSYRAQLAGWRIVFLPDVVAPAELPEDLASYRRQQRRWARGTTQVLRKQGRSVLAAPLTRRVRLGALLSLAAHLVHPVSLALFLLAPLVMVVRPGLHTVVGLVALAAASPPLMYAVAAAETRTDWPKRLLAYPLLAALGAGMTWAGTREVLAALRGRPAAFERTPKSGGRRGGRSGTYSGAARTGALPELLLAAVGWLCLVEAVHRGSVGFALLFALFASGYSLTFALLSWPVASSASRPSRRRSRVGARRAR